MIRLLMVLACFGLGACAHGAAPDPISISHDFQQVSAGPFLSILRDPSRRLSVREVLDPRQEGRWESGFSRSPSFGFQPDAFWVRFTLKAESSQPVEVVAELETARYDYLDWYVLEEGRVIQAIHTGNRRSHEPVPLRMPLPTLALSLSPGEERMVLIRVETETTLIFPLRIHAARAYPGNALRRASWTFAHLGLCMSLIVVSLLMGGIMRSRLFLFHASLVASYTAHSWVYNGYYNWLQWPWGEYAARQGVLATAGLGLFFLMAYVREFYVQTSEQSRFRTLCTAGVWVMGACVAGLAMLPYTGAVRLLSLCWVATNLFGAAVSIWQYAVRKRTFWRFNLAAWGLSCGLVFLTLLELWGVIPVILNPENVMRNLLMVLAVLLLVAIVDRLHLLERQDRERREEDRRLAEARFQALRYQVNPHFLFNTLNSIEALSREQPAHIPRLVRKLAVFLRRTLETTPQGLTPLRAEIESVRAYLDIESVRFEERLAVEVNASSEAESVAVPDLILQPLVENAVKHGMKVSNPLRIQVGASVEGEWLEIRVANSGTWIEGGREREGVGLKNLRERLNLKYGKDFEFTWKESFGWVEMLLRLPVKGGGGA